MFTTKYTVLLFLLAGNVSVSASASPCLEKSSDLPIVAKEGKDTPCMVGLGCGAIAAVIFHQAAYATLKAAAEGRVMDTIKNGTHTLLIPTIIGYLNYCPDNPNVLPEPRAFVDDLTIGWLLSTLTVGTFFCLKAAHQDWVANRAAQALPS